MNKYGKQGLVFIMVGVVVASVFALVMFLSAGRGRVKAPQIVNANKPVQGFVVPEGWTTYKSEYGYEISYPKDWSNIGSYMGQILAREERRISVNADNCEPEPFEECTAATIDINPQWETDIGKVTQSMIPLTDRPFNGIPAKFAFTSSDNYGYIFKAGDYVFQVNFRFSTEMKTSRAVADQVLASFKMIEE